MPNHRGSTAGGRVVVTSWSYPQEGRSRRSRWHVVPEADPACRAVCGSAPRAGALVRRCRTLSQARREPDPICLTCARWLALRVGF